MSRDLHCWSIWWSLFWETKPELGSKLQLCWKNATQACFISFSPWTSLRFSFPGEEFNWCESGLRLPKLLGADGAMKAVFPEHCCLCLVWAGQFWGMWFSNPKSCGQDCLGRIFSIKGLQDECSSWVMRNVCRQIKKETSETFGINQKLWKALSYYLHGFSPNWFQLSGFIFAVAVTFEVYFFFFQMPFLAWGDRLGSGQKIVRR